MANEDYTLLWLLDAAGVDMENLTESKGNALAVFMALMGKIMGDADKWDSGEWRGIGAIVREEMAERHWSSLVYYATLKRAMAELMELEDEEWAELGVKVTHKTTAGVCMDIARWLANEGDYLEIASRPIRRKSHKTDCNTRSKIREMYDAERG